MTPESCAAIAISPALPCRPAPNGAAAGAAAAAPSAPVELWQAPAVAADRQLAETCVLLSETRDELVSTLDFMLERNDALERVVRSSALLYEGSLEFRLHALPVVAPWWARPWPCRCLLTCWLPVARFAFAARRCVAAAAAQTRARFSTRPAAPSANGDCARVDSL